MARRIILLSFIIFSIIKGQPDPFNDPVPMHIGNKYQWLNDYYDDHDHIHVYSLSVYEINEETTFDGKVYYKNSMIGSGWYRYDSLSRHLLVRGTDTDYVHMDFNALDGDNIRVYFADGSYKDAECKRGTKSILGENRQYAGYSYRVYYGPFDSQLIEKTFAEGVGRVDSYTSAIIYDKNGQPQSLHNDKKPQISFTPTAETKFDYFSVKAVINHAYNRLFTHEFFNNSEVNFINDAQLIYYYEKSGVITGRDSVTGSRLPWTWEFRFTCPLDTALMQNGYVFNYKIKATDKSLIPNITETPYYALTWNPDLITYKNFLPLKGGNKWLFRVKKYDGYHNYVESKMETVIATDSAIHFGTKYFYLFPWGKMFGYDTAKNKVLVKNNSVINTWVDFNLYQDELFDTYNFQRGATEQAVFRKKEETIFGELKEVCGFYGMSEYQPHYYYMAEDIGPVRYQYTTGTISFDRTYYEGKLIQAVINGKDSARAYNCDVIAQIEQVVVDNNGSNVRVMCDLIHNLDILLIGDVYMQAEYRKEGMETVTKKISAEFDQNNYGPTLKKAIFTDIINDSLIAGGYDYLFRIFAEDKGLLRLNAVYPEEGWYSVTGVKDEPEQVKEYSLSQNYPNPFNPSTVINYSLPVDSKVKITIYDMLGREVAEPVNGVKAPGVHSLRFDGSGLPSGVYIYTITASGTDVQKYRQVRKMLMLK